MVGVDTHVVLVSSPGGPVPTPMPMPFNGTLADGLATKVLVANKAVALVGSVANNAPPHIPMGGPFQKPPTNRATISSGSAKVLVENKAPARATDPAKCCNDPADTDTGHVVAAGTVLIG